ncbi:molybdate ABC transporter substrate-binding protein [Fulvivirgaceae bacterium BMA10]|uniref:Molybdate ABC transporter substrate-binding protein n=1 Tax=Splendidivirga corallicola TaxID=3051826 RepID=A0ABT8KHB9_9BACT|nr:molybdate ABC transporter substrate-binding protein [Fulvivirgaceae bacterium BMA10]
MKHLMVVGLFFLLTLSGCKPKDQKKLTIAAAANVRFAMVELLDKFQEETGIDAEIIISSSGKLTAQIMQGAPYDVFVSADMKYPSELFENGLTSTVPEIYAQGALVLWTSGATMEPSLELLLKENIKKIAIANPRTAPYGKAAIETLIYHDIYDKVKHKLVFGESISQTSQFILSGSADIGITAKSVVVSGQMSNNGKWVEIPQPSYSHIKQGVVILKKEGNYTKDAERFYNFLFSEKAKRILDKNGYKSGI